MKVLNDLYDYGLKIYQNDNGFKFSLDSILLAELVNFKKNQVILDFCSGNAVLPLILSTKTDNRIIGIEIQKDVYKLACESILYNKLDNQIEMINDNLINIENYFPGNKIDIITCNPPYFKYNSSSLTNIDKAKTISRHEVEVDLNKILLTANKMLKDNGTFYMVHRTERIQEILCELYENKFIVKELWLVKTNNNVNDVNMFLIKAKKNAKLGMKVRVINTNRKESYKNIFKEKGKK